MMKRTLVVRRAAGIDSTKTTAARRRKAPTISLPGLRRPATSRFGWWYRRSVARSCQRPKLRTCASILAPRPPAIQERWIMLSDDEKAKYEELRAIVVRLRAPDGCPWDREQTHQSLRPHLIQEAYEVLAVLDAGDVTRLPEELGDLLFQVLLHTQLADEAGEFTMTEVLAGLAAKLMRRHPHVFGERRLGTGPEGAQQGGG